VYSPGLSVTKPSRTAWKLPVGQVAGDSPHGEIDVRGSVGRDRGPGFPRSLRKRGFPPAAGIDVAAVCRKSRNDIRGKPASAMVVSMRDLATDTGHGAGTTSVAARSLCAPPGAPGMELAAPPERGKDCGRNTVDAPTSSRRQRRHRIAVTRSGEVVHNRVVEVIEPTSAIRDRGTVEDCQPWPRASR